MFRPLIINCSARKQAVAINQRAATLRALSAVGFGKRKPQSVTFEGSRAQMKGYTDAR